MQTVYPWHYKHNQLKCNCQGRQQPPAWVSAGFCRPRAATAAAPSATGPAGGFIWPPERIFSSHLLWAKLRFTSTQLHSPERLFLLTVCVLSLGNTCHDTWPSSFLSPSHFQSSNLCCLHSRNNFHLKSSSIGHFTCYQQRQASPRQPMAKSSRLAPKDQLMKCKTSGLFD